MGQKVLERQRHRGEVDGGRAGQRDKKKLAGGAKHVKYSSQRGTGAQLCSVCMAEFQNIQE